MSPAGARLPGAPASLPRLRHSRSSIDLKSVLSELPELDLDQLRFTWRNHLGGTPPDHLPKWLFVRLLAYRLQAAEFGDLDTSVLRHLDGSSEPEKGQHRFAVRSPTTRDGRKLKAGSYLVREWNGRLERVMIMEAGFAWNGTIHASLSQVAKAMTGTNWNGHRFFGLSKGKPDRGDTTRGEPTLGPEGQQ